MVYTPPPPPPPVYYAPPPPPPPVDGTGYITGLYYSTLGRAPDAAGLANQVAYNSYATQYGDAAAQTEFQSRFYNSSEAVGYRAAQQAAAYGAAAAAAAAAQAKKDSATNFLTGLYQSELGRAPDSAGMQNEVSAYLAYADQHGDSAAQTEFTSRFHNSTEAATYRTGTTYIDALYRGYFGRDADAAGKATQVAAYTAYASQHGVAAANDEFASRFLNSGEAHANQAKVDTALTATIAAAKQTLATVAADQATKDLNVQLAAAAQKVASDINAQNVLAAYGFTQRANPLPASGDANRNVQSGADLYVALVSNNAAQNAPNTTATSYTTQLYQNVLGRQADSAGLAIQVNAFEAFARDHGEDAAKQEFRSRFENSNEHTGKPCGNDGGNGLYADAMSVGTTGSHTGFSGWVTVVFFGGGSGGEGGGGDGGSGGTTLGDKGGTGIGNGSTGDGGVDGTNVTGSDTPGPQTITGRSPLSGPDFVYDDKTNHFYDPETGNMPGSDGSPMNQIGMTDTQADYLLNSGVQQNIAEGGIAIGSTGSIGGIAIGTFGRIFPKRPRPIMPDDVSNTTPIGRRGNPTNVKPGTNSPATIGGRNYTGHALDQMQSRGITPTVVEDTIQGGTRSSDPIPGRFRYYNADNKLTVIAEENGTVVTVYYRGTAP